MNSDRHPPQVQSQISHPMTTELTEFQEQEVESALKSFMDHPVSGQIHETFGFWLCEKFQDWDIDPKTFMNYAECFCFANNLHPHGS
jgi:hypothetical protein